MRLLHSKTLDLHEFSEDTIPPYAVFSHRWQEGEVLLRDIESGSAREKKGFGKIESCCAEAASRGLEFVWIDTLCIDKSSSAELSESLNSMYDWYHKSTVCLAYLVDVTETSVTSDGDFQRSVWFTRGWTLQELLAPTVVEFFNAGWQPLGTKASLRNEISAITGIHEDVLLGTVQPQSFSVAQRMSWAAGRITTKVEDMAYSLIGLFDVNMPMLYGEGRKAFMRLQEEIMKQSDDQTLFAWSSKDDNYRGLLARSPADFAGSSHFIASTDKVNATPYSMTNMGLSIDLCMVQWGMEIYVAALDCQDSASQRLGIYLTPLREPNQYARVMHDEIDLPRFSYNGSQKRRRIYVRQNISGEGKPPARLYGFWLRHIPPPATGPDARWEFTAWSSWNDRDRIVTLPPGAYGTAAVIRYRPKGGNVINLKLGFDSNFNPACQYGGHILGPRARQARDPRAFNTVMLSDWMDPPALEGVHVGDRLRGVQGDDNWQRVFVLDEIVRGQRMWVVYIASVEDAYWHPGRLCDGCGLVSAMTSLCRCIPTDDSRKSLAHGISARRARVSITVPTVTKTLLRRIRRIASRKSALGCMKACDAIAVGIESTVRATNVASVRTSTCVASALTSRASTRIMSLKQSNRPMGVVELPTVVDGERRGLCESHGMGIEPMSLDFGLVPTCLRELKFLWSKACVALILWRDDEGYSRMETTLEHGSPGFDLHRGFPGDHEYIVFIIVTSFRFYHQGVICSSLSMFLRRSFRFGVEDAQSKHCRSGDVTELTGPGCKLINLTC